MAAEQCYNESKLPFVNVQTARNRFNFSYLDIFSSTFGAPETLDGVGVDTMCGGVEDGGGGGQTGACNGKGNRGSRAVPPPSPH